MRKIIIMGTTHLIQEKDYGNDDFKRKLEYLIGEMAVQILFEEWSEERGPTVGYVVAKEQKPELPWEPVGPPATADFKTLYPMFCESATPQMSIGQYGPLGTQTHREKYMAKRISECVNGREVGLFVCGVAHLHSMSERLDGLGLEIRGFFCVG